ncbi:hypothetical protein RCL1_000977 [Eukaryota sp. TZLM3-RCL]
MRFLLVVCLIFTAIHAADTKDSVPGWMLHNTANHILTWRARRLSFTQPPDYSAGVSSFRMGPKFGFNHIASDSFAFEYNNRRYDSKDFDLSVSQLEDGSLQTCIDDPSIPLPFTLCRRILFALGEPFYLSYYTLDSKTPVTVRILEYIITEADGHNKVFAFNDNEHGGQFMVDFRKLGGCYLAFDTLNTQYTEFQVGPISGQDSALSRFLNNRPLNSRSVSEDFSVMIGVVFNVTEKRQATTFKALEVDWEPTVSVCKKAKSRGVYDWFYASSAYYKKWLGSLKKPSKLIDSHANLFKNAALAHKFGQNPSNGAITASFHPSYGFKSWSRDGVFASIILSSLGKYDEARHFLEFMSTVQLTEDNHFHTTYSTFDGSIVWFVEPQIDSSGVFPLAVLYYLSALQGNHYNLPKNVYDRVYKLMDQWVDWVNSYGFGKPDYSIWEESSSGKDGSPLETSYFTFSQSLGYAGLVSASKIAKFQGQNERASRYEKAAQTIKNNIEKLLFIPELGYFGRSLSKNGVVDKTIDASTMAVVFTGMISGSKAISHYKAVIGALTGDQFGIARYQHDLFFYKSVFNPNGQESLAEQPLWPVTTFHVALSELMIDSNYKNTVSSRLGWMAKVAAKNEMPIGEGVCSVTGRFIHSGSPDIYEHGGVFVLTYNILSGLSKNLNPDLLEIK